MDWSHPHSTWANTVAPSAVLATGTDCWPNLWRSKHWADASSPKGVGGVSVAELARRVSTAWSSRMR